MISWSNPDAQQGITAAQATKGVQINPINIAGLVSAIMENKYRQQQQQQQAINNIDSGIQGIGQYYQRGQANDTANAALYQSQYPGDNPSYAGYQDRVPDYGGTDALKSQQIANQLGNQGLDTQLTKAKINAENALGYNRYNYPPNSRGYDTEGQALRQQKELRIQAQDALDAAKRNYAGTVGVRPQDLSKVEDALGGYVPDKTAFPELGTHAAVSDASQGDYKDRVLSAQGQYKSALDRLQNLNTTPQQQGGGNVNSQISQIRQAYKSGQMSRADAAAALQALGISP